MNPIITPNQLEELINEGSDVLICDCRFDLTNANTGYEMYKNAHITGAIYVNVDKDLSGPKTGKNGRHPLPSPEAWAKTRQHLGIANHTHVVAYDSHGGTFASRLWWMLRSIGHASVQVLDGGLDAWNGSIGHTGREPSPLATMPEAYPYQGVVTIDEMEENVKAEARKMVIDARAPDRFRGENETLDPVGGHIPGATNRCFKENLVSGKFKSAEQLYKEFVLLIGQQKPGTIIHSCGSGVSACHNLLAMEAAGLSGSRLHVGSWSEWCSDPSRPIER
ncbi:sulfurtransferase [Polynucleobacter sp. MWH-UH24A]|uniref:sulfurtransferase n=1 Tax=Polynucleobacter sp. MWH-UH24A TaxID=2689110 RepID=UPI001BFE9BCA|nr:sulfurtransferase [Polynucleobacter sp. MWH-UH24A]QWD76472.1 sulfurtransferase [Polynucleobacter sp. MWH-UH24A]